MWFSMPKGCSGITVERQEFDAEVISNEGVSYFRAPDHFSPRILAIPGFNMAEPPEGHGIEDLPKADPARDNAIVELTQTVAAQKTEIKDLREDLGVASARITALSNDNGDLTAKLSKVTDELLTLQEEIEDGTLVRPQTNVEPIKKAK